jgi:hypothetical protein
VYGDIWKQLGALMEDSLSFVKSGEQGDVNLYCGCAVLLFAGIYFLNKEIRTQKRSCYRYMARFVFCGLSYHSAESACFTECINRWESPIVLRLS